MAKNIAVLASWGLEKFEDNYYCPFTHWVYLNFIVKKYNLVYLITPVDCSKIMPEKKQLINFDNLKILDMPSSKSYIEAQRSKRQYLDAISTIAQDVDSFYCRVPDPFCWAPALHTNKRCVMHFVGDIIDATKNNPNWSWLKKKVVLMGFYPEWCRIIKASKRSNVFSNGEHIARMLEDKGVKCTPVVSSTISLQDKPTLLLKDNRENLSIIYVGYLRYAKGINTLMETVLKLEEQKFSYIFNIVGNGEMYKILNDFIVLHKLQGKVILHGHIDKRHQLLDLLKNSDLFFFPSLSEGSPRVIIEAMSQGVTVLSTPVGSLPAVFKDGKDILFFPFNDASTASESIISIKNNPKLLQEIRLKAFERVYKEFTIDSFLNKIFK